MNEEGRPTRKERCRLCSMRRFSLNAALYSSDGAVFFIKGKQMERVEFTVQMFKQNGTGEKRR
jgi:hypothetical protein